MIRADVLTLIGETPVAHGMLEPAAETRRTVFCTVRSVGMNEMYTAMSQGLSPSWQFRLALAEEYQGERKLEFRGELYRVVRTYIAGDGIELTAERWDRDE